MEGQGAEKACLPWCFHHSWLKATCRNGFLRPCEHSHLLQRRVTHSPRSLPELSQNRRGGAHAFGDLCADPALGSCNPASSPNKEDATMVCRTRLRPLCKRSFAHTTANRDSFRVGGRPFACGQPSRCPCATTVGRRMESATAPRPREKDAHTGNDPSPR